MLSLSTLHYLVFFRNRELNHFYASVALMKFAEALIALFVPIYLYQLDYSVAEILLFYFILSLTFVIFSYTGARVVARWGVKHAILFSTPFLIAYYIGLRHLPNVPELYWLLPVVHGISAILYNFGFHLNFLENSKKQMRGREISFLHAALLLVNIAAPFMGGLIALHFGFNALYALGSALLVAGTFPLFLSKDTYKPFKFSLKKIWRDKRWSSSLVLSFSGYAIETIIERTLWPIFLIVVLVNVAKTGLVVTLSLVVSLLAFYVVGQLTDKGKSHKILRCGTPLYAIAWVARIFAASFGTIFAIDSYKNLVKKFLIVPWSAKSYDLASRRGYFVFVVLREIIFNLARVIVLPLLMAIVVFTDHAFTISFAIAAFASLGYALLPKK